MPGSLGDLLLRVGVNVSGFKEGLGDAIEALEKTGDRATKTGQAISKAFDRVGVGDASAKIASEMKRVQQSFDLLENAFKQGKISAEDFARAQAGVADKLRELGNIRVPVDQFEKLGDALKNLKIDRTAFQIDSEVNALKSSLAEVERAYKAGKISADEFSGAQRSLQQQISAVKFDTSGLERMKSTLAGIGSSMREVGGILTGAITLPIVAVGASAIKTAADFESLQIGLKAVTKEAGPLEAQLNRLKEVAKLPGLGFKEAVQGSINLQAAGFSAKTAERALSAFGNALATVGKGKADLDGVITALSQIASKGKVSAEEINQLAERLPQVRVVIKETFGALTDAAAFEKAGVTSEAFIEKLIAGFEKLPKATGGFKNDLENLRDLADQALNSIGKILLPLASQAGNAVAPLLEFAQKGAEAFAKLPGPVQAAAGAFTALLAVAGPLIGAGGLLAGAANSFITLGGSIAAAAAGVGPLAGVFATLSGALALAGPAAIAFGVAIAGWAIYEAVKQVSALNAELDRLYAIRAKGTQATAQQANEITILTSAIEQHNKALGAQQVVVSSTGKTVEQYVADLKAAVAGLDEYKGKQGAVIGQLKDGKIDIAAVAAEYRGLGASASGASKSVQEIQAANKAAAAEFKEAEKTLAEVKKLYNQGLASKSDVAAALEKVRAAAAKAHPELTQTGNAMQKTAKHADELAEAFQKLGVSDSTYQATKSFEELRREFEKIEKAYKSGKIGAEDYAKALAALSGQSDKTNAVWAKFEQTVEKIHGDKAIRQAKLFWGAYIKDAAEAEKQIERIDAAFDKAAESARGLANVKFGLTGIQDIVALQEALKDAGVSTETLSQKLTRLQSDYQVVSAAVRAGTADHIQAEQIRRQIIETEIALAKTRGESTRELERDLKRVNEGLEEHGVKVKGLKGTWEDFGKEVSTIITNTSQDIAKALIDGGKGIGEKLRSVYKEILTAATAQFIQPFVKTFADFLGNTIKDVLSGGFSSIIKNFQDLKSDFSKLLGIGSTAAGAAKSGANATGIINEAGGFGNGSVFGNIGGSGGSGGGARVPGVSAGGASGAASAASGLANAANIANIAGAVAQVAGVVIQAFQMSESNKTLDRIVEHTLQTKNELSNLRKDSWDREAHLMRKLDDIWATLRDRLTEIRDAARSGVSLNLSIGGGTQKANDVTQDILRRLNTPDTTVGDRLTETNSILRHIEGGISEQAQNIIRSLETQAATIIGQLHVIAENTHSSTLDKLFGLGGKVASSISGVLGGFTSGIGGLLSGLFGGGKSDKWAALTEENTRYAKGYLLQLVTDAQKYLPRLADINAAWYKYFEYFAGLMSAVERLPEAISGAFSDAARSMTESVNTLVQIVGNINPNTGEVRVENLDQLAELLSQSFSDLGNQFSLSIAGLAGDLHGYISDATTAVVGAIASMSEAFGKPLENLVANLKSGDTTGGAVGTIVKYTTDLTALLQTQASQAAEIASLKSAIQSTKDETLKAGLQAKLATLEAEKGRTDAAIAALREGMAAVATNTNKSVQTTASGTATVAEKLEALRTYYGQLVQDEMAILGKLPPDIRQQLEGGKLASDLMKLDGIDENTKGALRAYDRIVDELGAVKGAIEELGKLPATATTATGETSALNPDGTLDTTRLNPGAITTVQTDPGLQSVFAAIQDLIAAVNSNFARLFEVLANGVSLATQQASQQTTESNQTQSAIDANTTATLDGAESIASTVERTAAWTAASVSEVGTAIVDATRDTAAAVSSAVASGNTILQGVVRDAGWLQPAKAVPAEKIGTGEMPWGIVSNPASALAPVDWRPREAPGFEPGTVTQRGDVTVNVYGNIRNRDDVDYFLRQLRQQGLPAFG